VKKNFARAKLLRVITPSPERVEPECKFFGACGGCQYQHIDYAGAVAMKQKQIADLFERVGKIPRGSSRRCSPARRLTATATAS
jgi:23S rRNA (uracil1939-C5)-methyltransferase